MHPDLQLAGQHDAAGRHDEAINALARGARAGDVDCTAWLGLRLFTGDRAPAMQGEGLGLLEQASERGSGWAAARAAALFALGVRAAPDLRVARNWLVKAALKGWLPARRQLLALCDDRELAGRMQHANAPAWQQLADAMDVDAWQRSPPAVIQSDDPRVATFPGLISAEICDVFVSLAEGRLQRALVYDPASRRNIVDVHRSNTLAGFGLDAIEFVHVLLQLRMSAATRMPLTHFEAPTELHYAIGEQIANHFDFVDPRSTSDYAGEIARNGQRLYTFIVYLNEGYGGGETTFAKLGIAHKGSKGEGICFINALPDMAPDMRMVHAGEPVTSGEKWIVTQFIRSRPIR
jgi:prolyl 4-hydroxylase